MSNISGGHSVSGPCLESGFMNGGTGRGYLTCSNRGTSPEWGRRFAFETGTPCLRAPEAKAPLPSGPGRALRCTCGFHTQNLAAGSSRPLCSLPQHYGPNDPKPNICEPQAAFNMKDLETFSSQLFSLEMKWTRGLQA